MKKAKCWPQPCNQEATRIMADYLQGQHAVVSGGGSGIGLVLSREIVENHGGQITLENRPGSRGCIARISMPLGRTAAASVERHRSAI